MVIINLIRKDLANQKLFDVAAAEHTKKHVIRDLMHIIEKSHPGTKFEAIVSVPRTTKEIIRFERSEI